MRGLFLSAACIALVLSACNQRNDNNRRRNNNNDNFNNLPATSSTQQTLPSSNIGGVNNTLINGRTCTSDQLFGSGSRRITITAQPGVQQQGQMQITDNTGNSQIYTLIPANKYWLMPRSDNYDVIAQNTGTINNQFGNNGLNGQWGNNGINNQWGNNGINNNGVFGGGDAGHVTVAPSGNVYLRGVQYMDSSSGVVENRKITAKAVCSS